MTELSNLAKQNLSLIFNQRDRKKRLAAIKELWSAHGVLWTAEGTYIGHRAIERVVADMLRRYPEFDFAPLGEVDEIPEAARMRWSLAAAGMSPAATGLDVIVVSNSRIVAMYRFLNGAEL